MRRLYVPITPIEFEQLQRVAAVERRPVPYQAAVFIAERLARSETAAPATADTPSDRPL